MAVTVQARWIIDRLPQMVPARELKAGDVIDGKAVERAFVDCHVEDRESTDMKMGRSPWLHPDHRLALRLECALIQGHQPMRPGASREHQALRLICTARGPHHDAISTAFPALQRFTAMDMGAV